MRLSEYMKILFITPSPPNDLNRIRSKNILTELHKRRHKVTVVSLYKNRKERMQLDACETFSDSVIGVRHPVVYSLLSCLFGLFLPLPLRVSFCFSPKLHLLLKNLVENGDFDIVYVKRLRMAQYAKHCQKKEVLIDITDSMTKYYESLMKVTSGLKFALAVEEYFKHKKYEPRVCKSFNIVICSNQDRRYLIENFHCSGSHIHVLENGIDLAKWKSRDVSLKDINIQELVFWGVMNIETNELSCLFFIRNVMPLLDANFTFTIIGSKPGKELIDHSSDRIHFKGYINDIAQSLNSSGVFICPMVAGAGVKNKILEAAALGLPVISTTLGAEGLSPNLQKHIIIADTPQEFRDKILHIACLSSRGYKELISAQRIALSGYYDISLIIKNFEKQVLIPRHENSK